VAERLKALVLKTVIYCPDTSGTVRLTADFLTKQGLFPFPIRLNTPSFWPVRCQFGGHFRSSRPT
jgi:hypothetical protein